MSTPTLPLPTTGARGWQGRQLAQAGGITLAALALYVAVRLLPTGTNLSHMDFRVEGAGGIEMCDPSNPQFIPVVAVRSPVEMTVRPATPPAAGEPVAARVTLRTATGQPLGPGDLLIAHTRRLHLLIVDASLTDYQHVHPEPGAQPGEWAMAFTPRYGGVYRIFADFTPAATGRGLYASAELPVAGEAISEHNPRADGSWSRRIGSSLVAHFTPEEATTPAADTDAGGAHEAGSAPPAQWTAAVGDHVFTLTSSGASPGDGKPAAPRAGQPGDLTLVVTTVGGGPVALEKIMDAYAHLVAFDAARSGFAHLHPAPGDLEHAPDPARPTLSFKVTIPTAGRYVVWAQVAIAGREVFASFPLDVQP